MSSTTPILARGPRCTGATGPPARRAFEIISTSTVSYPWLLPAWAWKTGDR